jgi:ketosteroid isomerase-like protein
MIFYAGTWSAWSGPPEFHGYDGFLRFFAEWVEPYDEWTQEVERIIDAGDQHAITITRQKARLRDSGAWVEQRTGYLYTIENGRVVRGEVHSPPEGALAAAGLSD